jgi:hypothetical protein
MADKSCSIEPGLEVTAGFEEGGAVLSSWEPDRLFFFLDDFELESELSEESESELEDKLADGESELWSPAEHSSPPVGRD